VNHRILEILARAIGAVTVLTGLTQIVAPGLVLSIVRGDTAPTSLHFFRIIGMFMALFGGLLLQASRLPVRMAATPLLWCTLQKAGAAAAVTWAVSMQLMSPLALGIAVFDAASALLLRAYARSGNV